MPIDTSRRALKFTAAFVVVAIIGGVYFGAVQIGVWLPDLILPRRTLAVKTTPGGHSFRVVQYLNGTDFYTTELVHTFPDGKVQTHVLDGDDFFTWRVPLEAYEAVHTVAVSLTENRTKTIRW